MRVDLAWTWRPRRQHGAFLSKGRIFAKLVLLTCLSVYTLTHTFTHTYAHDSTHTHTHTHTHSVDILRVDGDDSLTAYPFETQTSSMNVPGPTCSESEANTFFCSHDSCEYRTPCNLMDSECTDDSSFIDAIGHNCAAWCGSDCSVSIWDTYTAAELTAVQTN
jgi:hypothetical protein